MAFGGTRKDKKMGINLIVARSKNNVIGTKDNKLPWNLPTDLKYFKEKTSNSIVVMGRKTFESLPFALPHRFNIILSRDPSLKFDEFKQDEKRYSFYGYLKSINDLLEYMKNENEMSEVWVIGGAQVYKQFLESGLVNKCYVTEVDCVIENNGELPTFELGDEWKLERETDGQKTEHDQFDFKFCIYEK